MLEFPPPTKEDRRYAMKIQYKARIEEERKPRFFNARRRKIGIDKEFLDKQVEERKHLQEEEKAKECKIDNALNQSSKLAMILEKRQEEEKRKMQQEIIEYRKNFQKPEERRDYDLYDPDSLKKSLPARIGKNDPRLGLSSAQIFEGEDSLTEEFLNHQRNEMRWWIEKQKSEQNEARRVCEEAEKAYQKAVADRDKRATSLERMERECRRKLNEATARFNQALADEREYRRRREAEQEDEDKKADIYNHMTSDFLTESKDQAQSVRGPNKPLAERYKGMTDEELQALRNFQKQQIHEREDLKSAKKKLDAYWDQLQIKHSRDAELRQREIEKMKADRNKQIAEENIALAEEQKKKQDYVNKVLYVNEPTLEFYNQFNKTCR